MSPTPLSSRLSTTIARTATRSIRKPWTCASCRQNATLRRPSSTSASPQTAAIDNRPAFVTTPIFYVNAAPHIGHMYSMILADVIKRWEILKGRKALLCTGTDEHGLKVQLAAALANTDPKPFCDKGAQTFQELADRSDVSYDRFIRTTDADHKEAVQYAWHLLQERGYLYESKHEGWYSVSDETFYPTSEVEKVMDPSTGRTMIASKETGKEVTWVSEINYRFRLSQFKEPLLKWYKENPDWIKPKERMQQVLKGIESGEDTNDLSVSRPSSRLTWGIPVPGDESQTMYVWLDALINYITASGYPWTPGREYVGGWPAHCQIIGKDITRFHCIYWPAFLMALDIPLPSRILTHGHWLLGNKKMSKSVGNVVNPFFALDRFGVDPLRFFFMLRGNLGKDSTYSNADIIKVYKSHLQARCGNLLSRLTRPRAWDVRRSVQHCAIYTGPTSQVKRSLIDSADHLEKDFINKMTAIVGNVKRYMDLFEIPNALKCIIEIPSYGNAFFSAEGREPWLVAKNMTPEQNEAGENRKLDMSIYLTAESMRVTGILLQPFMPGKAKEILDWLGVSEERRTLEDAAVGVDAEYGKPLTPHTKDDMLFPPLTSDE